MAINLTDFDKIWASTSPLTPYSFSDNNYKQGWNFVGATPPARQMWDSYMKLSDEKSQWLYNNKLSLSGGTMTGTLYNSQNDFFTISKTDGVLNQGVRIWGGYGYSGGASLYLYGKNHSSAGDFSLCAHDGTNAKALAGHADGTLTWAGVGLGGVTLGNAPTNTATNFTLPKAGTYLVITGHNSTAGTNGIFIVRTSGNNAFKMAGGGNITMTCSGTTITVTSSAGSAGVYYIFLG